MSNDRNELQSLREAFAGYLAHVSSFLTVRRGRPVTSGPLTVLPIPAASRQWFNDAEHGPTWEALVATSARIFSGEGHGKAASWWASALGHWFRRRGVYLGLLANSMLDPGSAFEQLVADVRAESDSTTLLTLLEGVRFSKQCLEFDAFSLVQPTPKDLEEMLQIPVDRVFYPHALASTERLTDHWYLRTHAVTPRRKIARIYLEDPFGDPLRPIYSPFPDVVEAALGTVILWDWQHRHFPSGEEEFAGNDPWRPFEVPFVIAAGNNPFERPRPAPPIDTLYYALFTRIVMGHGPPAHHESWLSSRGAGRLATSVQFGTVSPPRI